MYKLTATVHVLTLWLFGLLVLCLPTGPLAAQEEADISAQTSQTQPAQTTAKPALDDAAYKAEIARLREFYAKPADQWPAPTVDASVKWKELGSVPNPSFPESNPFSRDKLLLGHRLFFDPRLSHNQQMACASCHDPDLAWADGRTVAFGHSRQPLARNSPTLMNAGQQESWFWDGRAKSLEEQVAMVLVNPHEMNKGEAEIVAWLEKNTDYPDRFEKVYGSREVTLERVSASIATFIRTIRSGRSQFDKFIKGDQKALSDSALRGLHLFRTQAQCMNCHYGPNFTDNQFHDLGLSYYGRKLQDLGRYEITKDPKDVGAFKTPTLRNITRTAPYMHVGLFELQGVLNLYNAGMPTLRPRPEQENDPLFPKKSHLLKPLGLNRQDMDDLKAFLQSLEEPRLRVRPPADLATGNPDTQKAATQPSTTTQPAQ